MGLIALADGVELLGIFGIAQDRIVALLARGRLAALLAMEGEPKDDADVTRTALAAIGAGPNNCLITLTAIGHTPYLLAAAEAGRAAEARTIGISNNRDAPCSSGSTSVW
ncbi:MAG: hypothetical protein MO846_10880 [Candidatus Devosia symbiotica]|nr:hypothetical protein [Candidatus Devosia symbiotica]